MSISFSLNGSQSLEVEKWELRMETISPLTKLATLLVRLTYLK